MHESDTFCPLPGSQAQTWLARALGAESGDHAELVVSRDQRT